MMESVGDENISARSLRANPEFSLESRLWKESLQKVESERNG